MGYPYHKFFNFCYLDEEPESKYQFQLHTTKEQWKGKDPDIQDELWLKTPLQKEDEKEVYSFLDCHLNWYQVKGGNAEEFFKAIESTWDGSGNFKYEATAQAFRPALEWVKNRKNRACKLCGIVYTTSGIKKACNSDYEALKDEIETHREYDDQKEFLVFIESKYKKVKDSYLIKIQNKKRIDKPGGSIKTINKHPDAFDCQLIDKAFSLLKREHDLLVSSENRHLTFEDWQKGAISTSFNKGHTYFENTDTGISYYWYLPEEEWNKIQSVAKELHLERVAIKYNKLIADFEEKYQGSGDKMRLLSKELHYWETLLYEDKPTKDLKVKGTIIYEFREWYKKLIVEPKNKNSELEGYEFTNGIEDGNDYYQTQVKAATYFIKYLHNIRENKVRIPDQPILLESGNPSLDNRFLMVLYEAKYNSWNYYLQTKTVSKVRNTLDDFPNNKEEFVERLKYALNDYVQRKRPLIMSRIEMIIYYDVIGAKNIMLWIEKGMPDYVKSDFLPLEEPDKNDKKVRDAFKDFPSDDKHTYENWYNGKLKSEKMIWGGKKGLETEKILNKKKETFEFFQKDNLICNQCKFVDKYIKAIDKNYFIEKKLRTLQKDIDEDLEVKEKVATNDIKSFIWEVKLSDVKKYETRIESTVYCTILARKDNDLRNLGFDTACNYDFFFWLKDFSKVLENERELFLLNWYNNLLTGKRLAIDDHFNNIKYFFNSVSTNSPPKKALNYNPYPKHINSLDESTLGQVVLFDNIAQFTVIENRLFEDGLLDEKGNWVALIGQLVVFIHVIKEKGYINKKVKDTPLRVFFEKRYNASIKNLWKPSKRKEEVPKHEPRFYWITKAKN